MRNRILTRFRAAILCLPFAAAGCSSVNVWPFGSDVKERSRVPPDSTEYRCAGGKYFYLRLLDSGGSAWVMLPERQFRLDKVAAAPGVRYSNGTTTLEVSGGEASLEDGPANSLAGCKSGVGERGAGQ